MEYGDGAGIYSRDPVIWQNLVNSHRYQLASDSGYLRVSNDTPMIGFTPQPTSTMRFVFLSLLLTVLALPAQSQNASDILDRLADAWLDSVEGVNDYTVFGSDFTTHYKRLANESGSFYFKAVSEDGMTGIRMGSMSAGMGMNDWRALRDRTREVSRYVGDVSLRGTKQHVLLITDVKDVNAVNIGTGTEPDSIMMYINPSDWTLSRVTIHGGTVVSGASGTVTPTIDFEDYRVFDGLRVPFITKITMVGMSVDISQEQVDQARQAVAQLEERIADMPEAQRDMMMQRLKPQIERLQQLADSGTIEQVYQVQSVDVNPGLPDSMFEQRP